jgi:integrase
MKSQQAEISVYLVQPAGSPYFHAQWLLPGSTKRKTKSLKTANEDEADDARAVLEHQLNHEQDAATSRLTWEAFVELYREEHLSLLSTGRYRLEALTRFGANIKPRSLAAVNEDMIARHTALLRKTGIKPISVWSHLSILRAALRWAVRRKFLRFAPHVEAGSIPRKVFIRSISPATFVLLLAGMPTPAWKLLAQLGWYAGLRRGELAALRWDRTPGGAWVDLDLERIFISAESGKADEDEWIPMHPELKTALLEQRQTAGPVFPWRHSLNCLGVHFMDHARAAGLDVKLHDLRRSFGTRYAALVPAQVLQRLMRHADIQTTMRYYANLDGSLAEAIRKA